MASETRRPLLVAVAGASGLLGLFQGAVLVFRNQDFGNPEMAIGLLKLAMVVGFVTMGLLIPVTLLLRRWLPAWPVDRLRASWTPCIGLVGALTGWMIGQFCIAPFGLRHASGTVLSIATALVFGRAATFLQPPAPWLKAWAIASGLLLAASFLPYPRPQARKPEEKPPAPATAKADAADVVLISIDTLRADHLGVYGQSPTLTPEIDRLAKEGVVFDRVLAAAPWTTPSVASLLTGLPVTRHGAGLPFHSGMTFMRTPLDSKLTTLAERFKAAGYRTRAIVTNGFISADMGFAQGFDEFSNPAMGEFFAGMIRDLPLTRLIVDLAPATAWGDYRAEGITTQALRWLAEPSPAPLFLWVHYIDPHVPYKADPSLLDPALLMEMLHQRVPPTLPDGTAVGPVFTATDAVRSGALWLGPEDRKRIGDYYNGLVRYTDKHVGRILAALRSRTGRRSVIVALTADHGEEFWDHGYFEHGHDYYREVTWVPLVFWSPGVVPAGRRVETPAGLVDVAPTLLALAGLSPAAPTNVDEGRSLAALLASDTGAPAPPRFCGGNLYGLPAVLMEDGPWRCILRTNDVLELYDVPHDRAERQNLAFAQPAVADSCRKVLKPQLAAFLSTSKGADAPNLSAEQLESLKALGYAH